MSPRRSLLLAGGGLVALVVVGLGASTALAAERVPERTGVGAVDLSGLDRA